MWRSKSGHFVQIWRPFSPDQWPKYVEVEGRSVATTTSNPRWVNTGRELDLKRARRFAKAYKRAGFKTRILFRGNDGKEKVIWER